jgi:hypothetical protein
LKSLKSTPIDSEVESFIKHSKQELVLIDSKLEFIVELEFLSLLVEFQFFSLFLPKFVESKLLFNLVNLYIGSLMSTGFFGLTMIFG